MSVSHEEVVKAAQAEQILTSDVFKEAIEKLLFGVVRVHI